MIALETRRIISKYTICAFFLLLLVLLYFLLSGFSQYQRFLSEKNSFSHFESLKIERFPSIDMYGALGFRVLLEPSQMASFSESSWIQTPLQTNVNNYEIMRITIPQKGKSLFLDNTLIKGFYGAVLFFGSLFFLYLGLIAIKTEKSAGFFISKSKLLLSQLSRILLVEIIAGLFFALFYGVSYILGVRLSGTEKTNFLYFAVFSLIVFLFFYTAGLLISVLTIKRRKTGVVLVFFFWIVFVILIPSFATKYLSSKANALNSEEEINIKKFTTLLDFDGVAKDRILSLEKGDREARDKLIRELVGIYFSDVYKTNLDTEFGNHDKMRQILADYQSLNAFVPSLFFDYMSDTVSGNSYYSYLDFVDYIEKVRYEFMEFFYEKKFFSKDKKIESFIKDGENIFKAESRLPDNYWMGLSATFLYALAFFSLAVLLLFKKRNKKIAESEMEDFPLYVLRKEESYFVLMRSEMHRERLFRQLAEEPSLQAFDHMEVEDIDPDMPAGLIVPYLCKIRGIKDVESVHQMIKRIGFKDYDYLKFRKRDAVTGEEFKLIYAAIMLAEAQRKETIVVNDFFEGSRRRFERSIMDVLVEMRDSGKRLVYLGVEMYFPFIPSQKEELPGKINFSIVPVDFSDVSMR